MFLALGHDLLRLLLQWCLPSGPLWSLFQGEHHLYSPCEGHALWWVWGAKAGDWKGNLVDHLVLSHFLGVLGLLEERHSLETHWLVLHHQVDVSSPFSFSALSSCSGTQLLSGIRRFFQLHLDCGCFHARLDFWDGQCSGRKDLVVSKCIVSSQSF